MAGGCCVGQRRNARQLQTLLAGYRWCTMCDLGSLAREADVFTLKNVRVEFGRPSADDRKASDRIGGILSTESVATNESDTNRLDAQSAKRIEPTAKDGRGQLHASKEWPSRGSKLKKEFALLEPANFCWALSQRSVSPGKRVAMQPSKAACVMVPAVFRSLA